MHLDHKLPWTTISLHFSFIRNCPQHLHQTDLFLTSQYRYANDLNRFCRVFVSVVREFSETERHKYDTLPSETKSPKRPLQNAQGKLFSDEVCHAPEPRFNLREHTTNSLTSNPLSPAYQNLRYWVDRASSRDSGSYTTSDADLADAIKMLIILSADARVSKPTSRDAFSAILHLNAHPAINLSSLDFLSWGHSFGVQHVADDAVTAYISLNVAAALRDRDGAGIKLLETRSFLRFLGAALSDWDYPTQHVPHADFWARRGLTLESVRRARVNDPQDQVTSADVGGEDVNDDPEGFREFLAGGALEEMREYLETCFATLY